MLRNADGGGGHIFRKKRYKGVMFNVISVTRWCVGVKFPEKLRYVTLEWPRVQSFLSPKDVRLSVIFSVIWVSAMIFDVCWVCHPPMFISRPFS